MNPNLIGALLMMASMAAFTLNDTLVKLVGGDLPLFQLLLLRGVLTTALVYGLARMLGTLRFDLARRDWALIAARCVAEIGAAYCFLTALFNMPLANATAILQVLPLTVTLGTMLVFREQVGWRRMLAIGLGFCGMLLIVRPGVEGFNPYSVYALLAVVCVTVRDLATRPLSKDVPSMTVTLAAALSITVFSAFATLGQDWVTVDLETAGLIAGASVFILGGYLFSVMVMRVGDVGFVAPFRYTSLIWALILGWLVFGDWPDALTLAGALIVAGAGVFTLWRERALLRR